ncbi:MAG: dihydroorotate dehydrogenase-like protein [Alistipes sp.]|nr:dihydroorotate dehydrogenase-like protein [Alistipes sp.]
MISLKTTFAGLALRNPIIVGSCVLTYKPENNLAFEQAGAAAVVLKSLFEESIVRQADHLIHQADHPEAGDYMQGYLRNETLSEYIDVVRRSKQLCSIPIIASICCRSAGEWVAFAEAIERAGADALELNVMGLATARNYEDGAFERNHIAIVESVRQRVNIPIIVKLGANITNPVNVADRLKAHGAAGVVLFNRPYQIDIDVEQMEYRSAKVVSQPSDLVNPLRWVGITAAAVKGLPIALSGGVQSGRDVVKAILAGASAVEVCSAIYREGNGWICSALDAIGQWCSRHGFFSIGEFRARMSASDADNADSLERMQFMRYFGGWRQ